MLKNKKRIFLLLMTSTIAFMPIYIATACGEKKSETKTGISENGNLGSVKKEDILVLSKNTSFNEIESFRVEHLNNECNAIEKTYAYTFNGKAVVFKKNYNIEQEAGAIIKLRKLVESIDLGNNKIGVPTENKKKTLIIDGDTTIKQFWIFLNDKLFGNMKIISKDFQISLNGVIFSFKEGSAKEEVSNKLEAKVPRLFKLARETKVNEIVRKKVNSLQNKA